MPPKKKESLQSAAENTAWSYGDAWTKLPREKKLKIWREPGIPEDPYIGKPLAKPPTRPHGMVPSEEERVRAGQMSVLIYALTGKTPALIVSTPIAEVRALQIPVREFKSVSLQLRHDPQVVTDEDFLNMVHLLFKARYVLKDLEK